MFKFDVDDPDRFYGDYEPLLDAIGELNRHREAYNLCTPEHECVSTNVGRGVDFPAALTFEHVRNEFGKHEDSSDYEREEPSDRNDWLRKFHYSVPSWFAGGHGDERVATTDLTKYTITPAPSFQSFADPLLESVEKSWNLLDHPRIFRRHLSGATDDYLYLSAPYVPFRNLGEQFDLKLARTILNKARLQGRYYHYKKYVRDAATNDERRKALEELFANTPHPALREINLAVSDPEWCWYKPGASRTLLFFRGDLRLPSCFQVYR